MSGLQGFFAFILLLAAVSQTQGQCELKLDEQPKWFPLIWGNLSSVVYPKENAGGQWVIPIALGETLKVACSPPTTTNLVTRFKVNEVKIKCTNTSTSGLKITGPYGAYVQNFTELGCTGMVKEEVEISLALTSLTCPLGYTNIDIQFRPTSAILGLIHICFSPTTYATALASHTIHGSGLNTLEVSNNRPTFKSGDFYPEFSVSTAYSQSEQLKTMTALVGSSTLAATYIDVGKSFYFARGHLAPDGDFVHVYEQNATYYYLNVIPQWQSINNGNWKAMEMAIRDYGVEKDVSLKIWTGGEGVLALDDLNGNPVEIYLAKNNLGQKVLPVPKISIKVILDESRNAAVAVLMINNPHATGIPANDIICPDICNQITWITWTKTDIRKGYTYCCEVNALRAVFPSIPDLGDVSILT